MLKLGAQNISGLYVGGIKIKKAYLGGNLVYSASEPPVPVVCTVTLSVSPAGAGTAAGGGTYESGQTVTLTYTAADGYNFTGWYDADGTLLSTANPYSFIAAEDLSITARAVQSVQTCTISASIDPAGSGTVTGTGEYEQGASVTLTAAAADGYAFTGWQENGTVVSTDNPYTFTAAADRTLTAVFAAVPVSRLPEGYTEVEYIQPSTVKSGFTINTAPTTDSIIDGIFEITEWPNAIRYLIYFYPDSRHMLMLGTNGDNVKARCSSYTSQELSISKNTFTLPYEIKFFVNLTGTAKELWCNDQSVECVWTYTNPSNLPIYLNRQSSSTDRTLLGSRIKYLKISSAKNPEGSVNYSKYNCELIPCVTPDGVSGLYDLSNKKVYTPSEGSYTPGPAV